CELDRAVETDELDLDAAFCEVLLGEPRILRRYAYPRPLGRIVALLKLTRLGNHQAAEAEPEIERLVDVGLLLEEDVLADDADVGGPVQHVGRKVDPLQEEHAKTAVLVREDEAPRVLINAVDAELPQELERAVEQASLRQRERETLLRAHQALPATNRAMPARSARTATQSQPAARSSAAAA